MPYRISSFKISSLKELSYVPLSVVKMLTPEVLTQGATLEGTGDDSTKKTLLYDLTKTSLPTGLVSYLALPVGGAGLHLI